MRWVEIARKKHQWLGTMVATGITVINQETMVFSGPLKSEANILH